KCIQVGTHSVWSLLPRSCVWDGALLGRWLAQAQPFVREEEERFVFEDRAAEHTAKIILPLLRFCQTIVVHKPVLGVQHAIPEIVEQCAMEGISSRARHNRDLSARGASELRSERRGLNAKLLHGIHRHQAVGPARSAERW